MTEELQVTEEPVVKQPKVKERTLEELNTMATKNMSEKEIKKYVDYLRDNVATLTTQLRTMQEAFQGVQKQHQKTEQEYAQFRVAANTQIQFCKDTLAQAFKAVHYMQPLEV
jgi:hypothetical protein